MFSFFKKKEKPQPKPEDGIPPVLLALRQTLYSNASLEPLINRNRDDAKTLFPWTNFSQANEALTQNDQGKAIGLLKQIVDTPGLETRVYLQAWHTLVSVGELPPEPLRGKLQGAIIENHMDQGLDIVAAYADYTARYWNFTGTGIVWEARDPEIDKVIDNLFHVNQEIMKRIGIGLRDTPPVPPKGNIRIFLMAFDGSCVGEGDYDFLYNDEMGKYAINAAYGLMMTLMEKHKKMQK